MKNLAHPNMFPGVNSGTSAPEEAKAAEKPIVTDADVGGIAATPAPTTAWANPLLPKVLSELGDFPDPESGRRVTWAIRVIEHLKKHGPCSSGDLCTAFGLDAAVGINPYIKSAVAKGLIVRVGKQYALPPSPSLVSTEAAVPRTHEQKPAADAAKAIAAMRKTRVAKPTPEPEAAPSPTPTPAPAPTPEPAAKTPAPASGRKPVFVLFVGELQLLVWFGGGITIQAEDGTVELKPEQARALLVLVELLK